MWLRAENTCVHYDPPLTVCLCCSHIVVLDKLMIAIETTRGGHERPKKEEKRQRNPL